MIKGRLIYQDKIKDHPNIGVYGIFNTNKVSWRYFIISYSSTSNGGLELTGELCSYKQTATFDSIERYGKEVNTVDDGKKFIQNYKIKWETGSNNTTEQIREEKLSNILDGSK